MSNWKKLLLIIAYFFVIGIIFKINSDYVVHWLNKSLFNDFAMEIDPEIIKNSFDKGSSLVFLISLFVYAILGTFIVSIIIVNAIWAVFIIANQIKVQERNEFITFKELYTITSPKDLLNLIEIPIGISILTFVIFLVLLLLLHFISKKIANRLDFQIPWKTRFILLSISLIPLVYIYINPNSYNKYVLKYEEEHIHNWDPVKTAQKVGFVPSFVNTIKPDYMEKPEDYNKKNIKEIEQKYFNDAKNINREREKYIDDSLTIYYISETLIDPMSIPGLIENETPIPFISNIIEENISGTIFSQYIGGGTANIEWTVLTSFSLEVFNDPISTTPFSDFYADSNNHHTVLSLFDNKKVAIHPYTAHLYKRKTVYPAIGFNDFLYLDNGIQHTDKIGTFSRVSDAALNKDILREAKNDNIGFIHVLSMQNHAPHNGEIPDMEYVPEINTDIYPKDHEKEMKNYLQGLRASDTAIEELIRELEQFDIEVNLLLFGDHFPSLFNGLEDRFTEDQIHHTPWFIYMNNGRSINGTKYEKISPIFLTTILLKEGNYYVSPFQALLDQMLDAGIKRIGKDFIITNDGKIPDNKLDDERLFELIQDYRLIMYDALFGSNWLSNEFFVEHLE